MSVELPDEPKSRKELYLAKIAGDGVTVPDHPESRIEQYLAYIAENGGGGGGSDSKVDKSSFVYDSATHTLTITIQ